MYIFELIRLAMRTITENFNVILDHQKAMDYSYYSILNPPADVNDIRKTEDRFRMNFSDELKELYSLANGTISERHIAKLFGLFPSYDFINLDEAVYTYSLYENDFTLTDPAYGGAFTLRNHDYAETLTPQRNMFPIFADGCGDYYWVDLNENTKHYGQVLFSFDGDGADYAFNSLTSMLQTIAECYERNIFFLENRMNSQFDFRLLTQDNKKWKIIGKRNNPGLSFWDDDTDSE